MSILPVSEILRGAEKVPVGIPIMGGDTKIPEASFVYVPAYNIAAAAGYGAFNSDERIEKYIAFREDWVRVNLMSSPKNLFVIRAIGDSMKPAIEPGDMLLCDRGRTNYGEEGIFIIRLEGTLLVKNIQKLPQYRVKLWSTNTEYQPIEIDIKTITDFEVLAQVIWIAKSLV